MLEPRLGQAPVGFWDPAGFCDPVGFTADDDVASFQCRRSVELKHGRISMMAGMGYITPDIMGKLPRSQSATSGVPVAGWAQIAKYFGFVEFSGGFHDCKSGTPGDLTGAAWGDWAGY
ncbi:unnamed protein product, partial [Symbiodinium sp. CCMP2456]